MDGHILLGDPAGCGAGSAPHPPEEMEAAKEGLQLHQFPAQDPGTGLSWLRGLGVR